MRSNDDEGVILDGYDHRQDQRKAEGIHKLYVLLSGKYAMRQSVQGLDY